MSISINRVTNANVYLEGASLLGRAEEVNLPNLDAKMVEHKALGMVGTADFFAGFNKLEASIKWNALYQDVLQQVNNPFRAMAIQVRASIESYDPAAGRTAEVPAIIYLRGTFKNFPTGIFKQHDNVEVSSMMSVNYMKMEINGQAVVEFDVLANIYKANGEDLLAQYRTNLGA